MSKELETLLKLKPELRNEFGVDELGVFGSFADDSFNDKSDIDILVSFSRRIGWKFFDLKYFLEEKLKRKVDLVTKNSIRPEWRDDILKSTIYI